MSSVNPIQDDDLWADEGQETALVPASPAQPPASYSYDTDWLYQTSRRISIDNATRSGFTVKDSPDVITDLTCQIVGARSLHSHRQPDDKSGKARHADSVEWCESNDNKRTTTRGLSCAQCPAFADCSWKIELKLVTPKDDEEWMLTLPTVSAIRFKDAAAKVKRTNGRKVEELVWHLSVKPERSAAGNIFPAVQFAASDPTTGELLFDGSANTAPKPAATGVSSVALPALPPDDVPLKGDPFKAQKPTNGVNGEKTKHPRAVVQTARWPELIQRAVKLGYVPDDSTGSAIRMLNVVGAAGIESVNSLNLEQVWKVIEAHYQEKRPVGVSQAA